MIRFAPILALLLFGSCKTGVTAQKKVPRPEKAFLKIDTKPGNQNVVLVNDFGKKWKLRTYFPKTLPTTPALIIALHWAGSGNTYREFHDCLAIPGLKDLNTIVLSPEGENQLWNTENNVEKIRLLVQNAIKHWNVDPHKVAVIGYSNGGNGSWFFAENHYDLFSASIPMASDYRSRYKIEIPLYVIHGAQDDLFPIQRTKKWVDEAREKGSTITFVKNEKLSHHEGCNYVPELQKAALWLQNLWNDP